jgi:RND family efflux transporter MFP subunit
MTQKTKKIVLILSTLTLLAIVAVKLSQNKVISEENIYKYDPTSALTVEGVVLAPQSIHRDIVYTGTFQPYRETKLSAETQGKIAEMHTDIGDRVQKGETLISIDDIMLKYQLEGIDVKISGLQSDIERYRILAEADAIQKVQLEKAELNLSAAMVQKRTLLEQIEKSSIKAPFSGVVTAKLTEVGSFAAPGIPLLQISETEKLKFTANLSEVDIAAFALHDTYRIKVDALPLLSVSGKLAMVGSKADQSNSFPIQFEVKNTEQLSIKAGMFGKVFLQTDGIQQKFVIPSAAVVGTGEQPAVFVSKSGRAVLRAIDVEDRYADNVIVRSGLTAGDTLITKGFIELTEGALIQFETIKTSAK